MTFGTLWLIFNIMGNLKSPVAILMQVLGTAAPFFVLAFMARRWPRIAGVLLLATAVTLMIFFGWHDFTSPDLVNQPVVMILFLGPLVGSGIALLRTGVFETREEE
jgi:fatty acid desaturase